MYMYTVFCQVTCCDLPSLMLYAFSVIEMHNYGDQRN